MGNKNILRVACCLLIFTFFSCETGFETLKVTAYSPGNSEAGVLPGFYAEVEFNNDVIKNDIEENFTLSGDREIAGDFLWLSGRKFRFIPEEPVNETGRYVMEIPRRIRDREGNTMEKDFMTEFYIGADFIQPLVVSSDPPYTVGAAEGIPVNQNITILFSKSMNRESVECAFRISPDAAGYFVWSGSAEGIQDNSVTYTLTGNLGYGRLYTFSVNGNALDISGNRLGTDYTVNFITGNDFIPPAVNGAFDFENIPSAYWNTDTVNPVSTSVRIAVDFSEAMDRISTEDAFSITPVVPGNFEWIGNTAVFTPSELLQPETSYQIYIDKNASDINGLKLNSVYMTEIRTSLADSLYLKCGEISGTNDINNLTFSLLSTGAPLYSMWPLIIKMGNSNNYYIQIEFVSGLSPYTAVPVNRYSVMLNVRIETFFSGDSGTGIDDAEIQDIIWLNDTTAVLKLNPLTSRALGQNPALYRITLTGGPGGIKDINGNYAAEDVVFEFREEL